MVNNNLKKEIFTLIEKYFDETIIDPFKAGENKVPVAYPCFDAREVNSALDSLLQLKLSQGDKVRTFEKNFANYVGVEHAVAVNSGSSANLLALLALILSKKVKPGSEVIVPAATFSTVISPIIQNGLKPVFVDIEMDTYNVSAKAIEEAITDKTGLIMVVHSLGCAADMVAISKIAEKYKLPILEDCCESHGSTLNGKKVGSFGLISTYSFFVSHNMTTGEGGMVLSNDANIEANLRSVREFGRLSKLDSSKPRYSYNDDFLTDYDERYVFETIGYNVRMSDIHASLGIEQLKKLDDLNAKRIQNVKDFNQFFNKYEQFLQLPTVPKGSFHSFYGYPILVKENKSFTRTDLVRFLEEKLIETRAFLGGDLSIQPAYRNEDIKKINLENTKKILHQAFYIGCHPNLSKEQIDYIKAMFDEFMKQYC